MLADRIQCGLGQGAALQPLVPGDVPVAVSVVGGELGAGAGDLDDVAVAEGVVEPLRVVRGHVDAPVRHIPDPLVGDRPGGGVSKDPGVRQPHRERDGRVVAQIETGGQAVAARVHLPDVVLLLRHVDAARGDEGDHLPVDGGRLVAAHADRDLPDDLAVDGHGHDLGGVIDGGDLRWPDGQVQRAVGLAVEPAAQVHPVDLGVHRDLGAGLPVHLGPVVHGAFVHPVPAAHLRRHRGHGDGPFGGRLVRWCLIEDHRDRVSDADHTAVRRRFERREDHPGRCDRGERVRTRRGQPDGVPGHGLDLVGAGVAQRLPRRPGGPVRGQLPGDLSAFRVGHDHGVQGAVRGLHHHRVEHRHAGRRVPGGAGDHHPAGRRGARRRALDAAALLVCPETAGTAVVMVTVVTVVSVEQAAAVRVAVSMAAIRIDELRGTDMKALRSVTARPGGEIGRVRR